MLLLLRRALAQLRGDPPESRPNALRAEQPAPGAPYGPEWYGSVYPIRPLICHACCPVLARRDQSTVAPNTHAIAKCQHWSRMAIPQCMLCCPEAAAK